MSDQAMREMCEYHYCAHCKEKTNHNIYELPADRVNGFERKLEGQCKICGTTLSQTAEMEHQKRIDMPWLEVSVGDLGDIGDAGDNEKIKQGEAPKGWRWPPSQS